MSKIKGVAFDVYGTLLDPISIQTTAQKFVPNSLEFVSLWRAKQLEYSWLLSLMGKYENFWQITQRALDYTCAKFRFVPDDEIREQLLAAWTKVAPFPDVVAGLERLGSKGLRLAALSNGEPLMLEKGLENAGIRERLERVMSVDSVKIYKPSPKVYEMGMAWLGAGSADEIGFVSSNAWDAIGAATFGFQVVWLNRAGNPLDEIGTKPAKVAQSFSEVVEYFVI
jgi:2-haloacid dehalogenase